MNMKIFVQIFVFYILSYEIIIGSCHLSTPLRSSGSLVEPSKINLVNRMKTYSGDSIIDNNNNGKDEESYNDDLISSSTVLFDLNSDPYETTNLYSQYISTNDEKKLLQSLVERAEYWQTQVKSPEIPSNTNKMKAWSKADGVTPWLTSTTDDDLGIVSDEDITQLYDYKDAPHIVFVLVDDWGWNDFGLRSTYLNWTTPTIDRLGTEGILLENYYSASTCTPARGSLMTGRYSIRLGLWDRENSELPLSEATLAQEMKSAGYRTYMVGKWHLGYSTYYHVPSNRGFDSFYGYYNGFIDYWTKEYGSYLDLQDGLSLVTESKEIDSTYHNGYLMQAKTEEVVKDHATYYSDQPMFLYYAMQLIHGVWSAPETYLDRCGQPSIESVGTEYLQDVIYNYCALNVMLDEAISNLTCTLEKYDMNDNTILFIVSDNGGESTVDGNNYPFRGAKGSTNRGGISVTAMIHSKLIPDDMKGQKYNGLMHVTDWLPTLMSIATDGEWVGSLVNSEIDGVDMWKSILTNTDSPRSEIVHYADGNGTITLQSDHLKLQLQTTSSPYTTPIYSFPFDLNSTLSKLECLYPSLMYSEDYYITTVTTNTGGSNSDTSDRNSNWYRNLFYIFSYQRMHMEMSDNMMILVIGLAALFITSTIALSVLVIQSLCYPLHHDNSYRDKYDPRNKKRDLRLLESTPGEYYFDSEQEKEYAQLIPSTYYFESNSWSNEDYVIQTESSRYSSENKIRYDSICPTSIPIFTSNGHSSHSHMK